MTIDNIVSVNITRQTSAPTAAGFGTLLLLGANVPTGMQSYSSIDEMSEDFGSSDVEYKMGQAYFGQAKAPSTLKAYPTTDRNGGVFILKQGAASSDFSLSLNGQVVTGAALGDLATALEALDDVSSADVANTDYIVVKLNDGYTQTVTAVAADTGELLYYSDNVSGWDYGEAFDTTATIDVDGTTESSSSDYQDLVDTAIADASVTVADGVALNNEIYLIADAESTPNTLTDGVNGGAAAGAAIDIETVTLSDILDDALDADNDFYGIALDIYSEQDVLIVAAWAESAEKLFFTRTDDSDVLDSAVSTDIISQLSALSLDRTVAIYHGSASSEYIDAALAGRNFPEDPGSLTWNQTQLSLVSPDALTSAQKNAVQDKKGNTYTTVKGVSILQDGRTTNEWIDIIRGIDWHKARLEEQIFSTLLNSSKIPYTNKGVAIIEAIVRAKWAEGIRQGLFASDPALVVTTGDVADQSDADRSSRQFNDISYEGKLAGAIHKTTIQGTVSV